MVGMTMRSFGTYYPPPSSSPLSSSLFFNSSTKPLQGALDHRPLLYGQYHQILTSCSLHGSFSSAEYAKLSRDSSFGFSYRDHRDGRHASTECKSYGGNYSEASSDLSGYGRHEEEPARLHRSYAALEIFNRSVGEGYGASEAEPASARRSSKSFGKEASPDSSYRRAGSSNKDSPASRSYRSATPPPVSYSRPQSYSRGHPARANRLHEFVSSSYGVQQSSSEGNSSAHGSPLSHGRFSRDFTSSPFKNATVSVFWDLDNKPPKSSPYHAGLYLRHAASQFGSVIDMVAYANHHAFTHVPDWVREQRRDRKELDFLEQKGIVEPDKPYVCNLCGRKCKTNLLLKKHFKQLHEREHNKRMSRLNSLKGKKRQKYRESTMPKTQRYKEAANPILVPKVGYGLESDLRRAGIFVKTVQYKPQAADIELKKQMADSMHKGVKCICLVSDDTDFSPMLADARALNLRTVVFGESRSLKRFADFWFPWDDISRGVPAQDFQEAIHAWTLYHHSVRQRDLEILAGVRDGNDLDVEHKVFGGSSPMQKVSVSAFTEEEHQDAYGSSSDGDGDGDDDDAEWSFEDEVDELDDEWEDAVDDDKTV